MREFKGNSKIDFFSDFCVVDIETTGINPNYDNIIEIGAIKVRDGNIVDRFTSLIRYTDELDEFIVDKTNITNEMLMDAPELDEVLKGFIDFVADDVIVGHNINFDINFLYDNIEKYLDKCLKNDFVDTLRLSRKLLTLENHRLGTVAEHFKINHDIEHRALLDCEITLNCYKMLKTEASAKFETVEDFAKSFKKKSKSKPHIKVTTDNTEFDETHPLYCKSCVFTGTLENFTRNEAAQLVVDLGGYCKSGVTTKTDYLILGNTDYIKGLKNGVTGKFKKAMELKKEGYDIEIITESTFFDLLK